MKYKVEEILENPTHIITLDLEKLKLWHSKSYYYVQQLLVYSLSKEKENIYLTYNEKYFNEYYTHLFEFPSYSSKLLTKVEKKIVRETKMLIILYLYLTKSLKNKCVSALKTSIEMTRKQLTDHRDTKTLLTEEKTQILLKKYAIMNTISNVGDGLTDFILRKINSNVDHELNVRTSIYTSNFEELTTFIQTLVNPITVNNVSSTGTNLLDIKIEISPKAIGGKKTRSKSIKEFVITSQVIRWPQQGAKGKNASIPSKLRRVWQKNKKEFVKIKGQYGFIFKKLNLLF